MADDLVMGDERAIYADKAYEKHSRRAALKARGIKDRIQHRTQGPVHRSAAAEEAGAATLPPAGMSLTDGKEAELPSRGVRRKYFAMPPMELEEALHQLDLIDHDFYVFRDAASGQVQVVYRRNHGGFGVIQPKNA